jgi:hypothetical protein
MGEEVVGDWVTAPEDAAGQESRELYALAGLAFYHAQTLEHEIVNTLGLGEIIRLWKVRIPKSNDEITEYRTRVDEIWDENYERTLGQLLGSLRQSGIVIPAGLDSLLRDGLKTRNRLVHSYFRERAQAWFDAEGRRSMAKELTEMSELFRNADSTLHEATANIRKRMGMTDEKVNALAERMKTATSEEEMENAISDVFGKDWTLGS